MSKTKKLPDVQVVTTLSDTEALTVLTASGVKQISFEDLKKLIKAASVISGRNLLSRTFTSVCAAFTKGNGSITLVKDQDAYFNIKLACEQSEIEYGQVYTLSFRAEGMQEGDKWGMSARSSNPGYSILIHNGFNSVSFVVEEAHCYNGHLYFDDTVRSFQNGFHEVKLSQFKLERGNVATGWSLAPEEILANFGGG